MIRSRRGARLPSQPVEKTPNGEMPLAKYAVLASPTPTRDLVPVPAPMDHRAVGQPCGGSRSPTVPEQYASPPRQPMTLPRHLVRSMDRHVRSPLPADPIPEGSQRLGMGPRSQARWLLANRSEGWQPGQALHSTRLRLVGQVSASMSD